MATLQVSQKWKYAQQVEKELQNELKSKDHLPRFGDIDNLIKELRIACEATIFLDFQYATREEVELRLWAAHSIIKDRYKKLVTHYREKEPRKHVERRKLEQRYADFIKTTQYFYRGYIQRLASHFSVDARVQVSPEVEDLIEKSCHATLLRLGDLSRYRNELRTKERSWETALGYYSLAGDLCPDSGSSHNQMAVISLADVNHLDAVYHLYRAIAVNQPHPLAEGNLEIEFKKITTAWEKKKVSNTKGNNEATLILWFVRLHARFYTGVKFSGYDELENEVLSRLGLLLKEQSFETTLQKLILINIAAEYFAGERVKKEGSGAREQSIESFYFFLRFNVRFLVVLLQTIQPELEEQGPGESLPSDNGELPPDRAPEKITAIARRVLPALRQYSTWLVSRALIIISTVGNKPINVYIREMWSMYTSVLTKLIHFFPVAELPVVNYLLEEDEITVGFKPFRDPDLDPGSDLYTGEDGLLKPRSTDAGIERNHPNVEMKGRVRDIILCALVLRQKEKSPIELDTSTFEFTFIEEALRSTSSSHIEAIASPQTSPRRIRGSFKVPESVTGGSPVVMRAKSVAASDSQQSMDTDMHRMVDNLVEPSSNGRISENNETSYGMHTNTANEVFLAAGSNGYHAPHINTQNILPRLPGFSSSPFTPQPNELAYHSPKRPTTAHNLSPVQLANSGQHVATAPAFGEMTSYGSPQGNVWARGSTRSSTNPTTQTDSHILQEFPAQQSMPMQMPIPSSGFSDSTSIYANTPQGERGAWSKTWSATINGNNTSTYAGASDFEGNTLLRSSIWNDGQPGWNSNLQTPPGGQGG